MEARRTRQKWTAVSIGDLVMFLCKLTVAGLVMSVLWGAIYLIGFVWLVSLATILHGYS